MLRLQNKKNFIIFLTAVLFISFIVLEFYFKPLSAYLSFGSIRVLSEESGAKQLLLGFNNGKSNYERVYIVDLSLGADIFWVYDGSRLKSLALEENAKIICLSSIQENTWVDFNVIDEEELLSANKSNVKIKNSFTRLETNLKGLQAVFSKPITSNNFDKVWLLSCK